MEQAMVANVCDCGYTVIFFERCFPFSVVVYALSFMHVIAGATYCDPQLFCNKPLCRSYC